MEIRFLIANYTNDTDYANKRKIFKKEIIRVIRDIQPKWMRSLGRVEVLE